MPEDLLTMSAKEVDRAGLIRRVLEGRLPQVKAAELAQDKRDEERLILNQQTETHAEGSQKGAVHRFSQPAQHGRRTYTGPGPTPGGDPTCH
jgi:hypothetical protein